MGLFNKADSTITQPNPEVTGAGPNGANPPDGKSQAELLAEGLEKAFAPVKTTLEGIVSRVDNIEKRFKPAEPSEPVQPNAPQYTSVFEDEDAAINQRVVAAVGPVLQMQLETQAQLARQNVRAEFAAKGFGAVWDNNLERINKVLDDSPLLDGRGKAMRGDPSYIRNVVTMIFGEAAMAAGMKFGKDRGFFLETTNGSVDTNGAPQADGLTDEQRAFFKRNKISVEDGKKARAALKFVS